MFLMGAFLSRRHDLGSEPVAVLLCEDSHPHSAREMSTLGLFMTTPSFLSLSLGLLCELPWFRVTAQTCYISGTDHQRLQVAHALGRSGSH